MSRRDDLAMPMGSVDVAGVTREVCLALVPTAVVGTNVVVLAGIAIAELDADQAASTLALLADLEP